jgi:hypothetical protein
MIGIHVRAAVRRRGSVLSTVLEHEKKAQKVEKALDTSVPRLSNLG